MANDPTNPSKPSGPPAGRPPDPATGTDPAPTPRPPSEHSYASSPYASGASSHGNKPRRGWTWTGIIVLLILVIVGIEWWRDHEAKEKAAEAARRAAQSGTPITVATAQKGNIGVYLDAIGTVTAVFTDSITSQVSGQVVNVFYKEGQVVSKGDPLVDIDPRPYRATLLQAQGTLEKDQNVLAQAELDLDRYKAALARNAIAEQIEADQEKLVAQDKGSVKNDEGTVAYDQVQVDFCHITAPISGRVGLRLVDPGNVVQANGTQVLAVVTQIQPITVVFTIPEDSLGQVETQLRKQAKLTVDVYDRTAQTKIATGQLIAVDNQIDTTTGTVKGRAQFANSDNSLFPNEFVNTRLLVTTKQGVTLVPSSAIQQNGSSSFVYVIESDYAHLRPVKPGVTDSGQTEVEGVNPGEVIANSGFDKLQDSARVAIATGGNQPPSGTRISSGAP
jgi:membrane fusion protein, multidrug efflux system